MACACSTLRPAGGWLAGQSRARTAARGAHLFQPQPAPRSDQRLRASCLFCSFARLKPSDAGAHTMSVEQVLGKLRQRAHEPLTEVHIVNGLHPELPFDYYKDLLRGLKGIRPDIHLKCFTAVEIAYFADLYGMTDERVLVELREAGLDSLPGGGAEIFAARVRARSAMTSATAIAIWRFIAPLIDRHAHQRHDAVRPHRDDGGAGRPSAAGARPAGRDGWFPGLHPARVPPRQQSDAEAAAAIGQRHAARARRRPLLLDNVDHIKAYWISSGSRSRRRRCGLARTIWTGRFRKKRSITRRGRRRLLRCPRTKSKRSSATPDANRSNATRFITWSACLSASSQARSA